jgi:CRISPR-associated endonuclease/helicase Cas3
VIIFDEVQTLPSHLLNPLLNVFRDLCDNYSVSWYFPPLHNPYFATVRYRSAKVSNLMKFRKSLKDTSTLFASLRRVTIYVPKAEETTTWDKLAFDLAECKQSLCIVNVRNDAYILWEKLRHAVSEKVFVGYPKNKQPLRRKIRRDGKGR